MRLMAKLGGIALGLGLLCGAAMADDWKPVPPEDLHMTEVPGAKGAHAAILYFEDTLNDKTSLESIYFRIKILTEEGKKYADIELPPYFGDNQVNNLKARTIHPDGSIVPFDGKFFTKVVAKRKNIKLLTKTFSIPDAQPGSIIEYRYNLSWDPNTFYSYNHITLQHDLFTRQAHITVIPYDRLAYSYTWFGLPPSVKPVQTPGYITLDAQDLPAFEKEDYMPPEDELRARLVIFKRLNDNFGDIDSFWKQEGKTWRNNTEKFLDKKKAMQSEVSGLLNGANTNEEKLRRIYDRVQKINNLTYAREKTEKEIQHDKQRVNNNVEDVLRNGYGWHNDINKLFVAMARAAGFDATVVRVTERDGAFFHKNVLSISQLDVDLGLVKLDGKDVYFSPATPYCPFGFLPWEDTEVTGIRDDRDGTSFVTTPMAHASETKMTRTADLTFNDDNTLAGEMTVTFTGMEALSRRLAARDNDEVGRKKDMEDELKSWLPTVGSTAEIISVESWESTAPLVVKAKVTIPGFGNGMGKRVLLPAYAFHTSKGHAFQKNRRVQPVYFRNPWEEEDTITIKLPDSLQVESVPNVHNTKNGPVAYLAEMTKDGNQLKLHRHFVMDNVYYEPQYYGALQQFFDSVKAGDDEQVVLKAGRISAAAK